MPTKDQTAPRTPYKRPTRAKPDATQGRPTKGADALVAVLACKVSAGEQGAVRAAAKAAGLSESAWLRRAAQDALARADHARQYVAHLEAMGGMPSATP
jgi:hypothetical protein